MSATTSQLSSPPAPWKAQFLDHVNNHMPSPEFVLATLAPAPTTSPVSAASTGPGPHGNAPVPYLPRARYCIFRGMWAELPENKHNDAPRNARVYESDLPTFTTDVRMQKVGELFASSEGKATKDEQVQGSGGGGPVEAVWWVKGKENDVMVQWRIKGRAYVLDRDIESEDGTSGTRTVKSAVGERMRVVQGMEGKTEEWSWGKELTGHFGNCSPGMRGTWKNPPPGTKAEGEPDAEHKLGQKVESLDDGIARSNFRVVIIRPDEVESTDLSDPEKAHRKLYRFTTEGGNGKWTEETLWP